MKKTDQVLDNDAAVALMSLKTAQNHYEASEVTLKNVRAQIPMRSLAIAQIAATFLTNAHPRSKDITPAQAVTAARELLKEVDKQESVEEHTSDPGR